MPTKEQVVETVKKVVGEYFAELDKKPKAEHKYKVPLMSRLYNEEEVSEVVETLLSPDRLTLNASGELKIEKFEEMWADFLNLKNAIMVNSGSSANLISTILLTNPSLKKRLTSGNEVITPALTYGATVSPLYMANLKPVFVDANLEDYSMNIEEAEKAITPKTKAMMIVHLLGFPVDMKRVMNIAEKHGLYVIEDCCEAHGAEIHNKKVGSFGDISTLSFYLSHHITTIEGGMIMTNNDELAELARIIRSQGVMRNVKDQKYKEKINSNYPDIDPRFLFANIGYNFRPTEMEGAFGIAQFNKFQKYMETRRENARFFTNKLSKYQDFIKLPVVKKNTNPAWFCYPIMKEKATPFTTKELISFLEKGGIETRPIMSGNYTKHPVAKLYNHRISSNLRNTQYIHENAFFIGVHAGLGKEEREHVVSCFEEFLDMYC